MNRIFKKLINVINVTNIKGHLIEIWAVMIFMLFFYIMFIAGW